MDDCDGEEVGAWRKGHLRYYHARFFHKMGYLTEAGEAYYAKVKEEHDDDIDVQLYAARHAFDHIGDELARRAGVDQERK